MNLGNEVVTHANNPRQNLKGSLEKKDIQGKTFLVSRLNQNTT